VIASSWRLIIMLGTVINAEDFYGRHFKLSRIGWDKQICILNPVLDLPIGRIGRGLGAADFRGRQISEGAKEYYITNKTSSKVVSGPCLSAVPKSC
jgi:hypothetical protein